MFMLIALFFVYLFFADHEVKIGCFDKTYISMPYWFVNHNDFTLELDKTHPWLVYIHRVFARLCGQKIMKDA